MKGGRAQWSPVSHLWVCKELKVTAAGLPGGRAGWGKATLSGRRAGVTKPHVTPKKKKPKKTCQRPLGEREEEKRANRHKAAGD